MISFQTLQQYKLLQLLRNRQHWRKVILPDFILSTNKVFSLIRAWPLCPAYWGTFLSLFPRLLLTVTTTHPYPQGGCQCLSLGAVMAASAKGLIVLCSCWALRGPPSSLRPKALWRDCTKASSTSHHYWLLPSVYWVSPRTWNPASLERQCACELTSIKLQFHHPQDPNNSGQKKNPFLGPQE